MTTDNKNIEQNPKFILTIVWGALLFSMFIYLYVLHFSAKPQAPQEDQTMFNVLVGLGIASTFASQFVYQKAIQIFNAVMASSRSKTEAVNKTFVLFVITWALGESIAIFGLVAGFAGYELTNVYSFFAAAVVLHLFRHPFKL